MPKQPDFKLVHLHAQQHQHDEAYIVANRAALTALRDALDVIVKSSLEGIEAWSVEAMAADGEGYNLIIVLDDSAWASPTWRKAMLPYTGEGVREWRTDILRPREIADEPRALTGDRFRATG